MSDGCTQKLGNYLWHDSELIAKVCSNANYDIIPPVVSPEVTVWFQARHEETRIMCLLQRHFTLSLITGYNLARDRTI